MSFDLFGLGQGLNNLQNNLFQQDANAAERAFERSMSEEEFRRNVEMWERTNTYNSPVEQMKRLQAAGLNPALMYGKSASPGIASPAPNINLPKSGHYGENMQVAFGNLNNMQGILNAYNDLRRTNADVDLKKNMSYKSMQDGVWKNIMNNIFGYTDDDVDNEFYSQPMVKAYMDKLKAEAGIKVAEQQSKESEAKFNTERWRMYSEEGIFLDQLTNVGKRLERELGTNTAIILDALLGKIKSR